LDHGTPVDARNVAGQTALIFALATARAFSRRQGPKVNPETVSLLLDAGASLDEADALDLTPVHHAVQIADPAFVDLLMARKDNFLGETKSGYSVMLHACIQPASNSKIQIMERLAAMGLDLNKASQYGEFPLGVCLYILVTLPALTAYINLGRTCPLFNGPIFTVLWRSANKPMLRCWLPHQLRSMRKGPAMNFHLGCCPSAWETLARSLYWRS
jgi:hypothetical protein